jgi:hypothetical protein
MKRASGLRAIIEVSRSLQQQLNSYARAASAAGVGLLALAQPSESKVVYTPAHAKVVFGQQLPVDLNHDGIADFYLFHLYSDGGDGHALSVCQVAASSYGGCSTVNSNAVREVVAKGRHFAAALRSGVTIQKGDGFRRAVQQPLGGVRSWRETSTRWYGPWVNGGKGVKNRYLGLEFKIKGRFHFGWARFTITTSSDNFTATLTGYAYETIPGKAIIAGKTKGSDGPDTGVEQPSSASLQPADRVSLGRGTAAAKAVTENKVFNEARKRCSTQNQSFSAAGQAEPTSEPATLGMLALGSTGCSIWRREDLAEAESLGGS